MYFLLLFLADSKSDHVHRIKRSPCVSTGRRGGASSGLSNLLSPQPEVSCIFVRLYVQVRVLPRLLDDLQTLE